MKKKDHHIEEQFGIEPHTLSWSGDESLTFIRSISKEDYNAYLAVGKLSVGIYSGDLQWDEDIEGVRWASFSDCDFEVDGPSAPSKKELKAKWDAARKDALETLEQSEPRGAVPEDKYFLTASDFQPVSGSMEVEGFDLGKLTIIAVAYRIPGERHPLVLFRIEYDGESLDLDGEGTTSIDVHVVSPRGTRKRLNYLDWDGEGED